MRALAIGIAILGLLIASYFVRKGPTLTTPAHALTWTKGPLDAGDLDLQYSLSGVDFIRAHDAAEPILSFAVLRRGEQLTVVDDLNWFHAVEHHDGKLWALGESTTEGPGPTLDLLVSEDEGRTFELRASVPKPNYQATFESWTVHDDDLTLVLSIDDEIPMSDDWLWPWWQLDFASARRPTIGPGRFRLRSKNGGRSWRFER